MKHGKIWEKKTSIGNFSIMTDWDIPQTEIGKFKPFWNGCGIGPGFNTKAKALKVIHQWAMAHYNRELQKAEARLEELQDFCLGDLV